MREPDQPNAHDRPTTPDPIGPTYNRTPAGLPPSAPDLSLKQGTCEITHDNEDGTYQAKEQVWDTSAHQWIDKPDGWVGTVVTVAIQDGFTTGRNFGYREELDADGKTIIRVIGWENEGPAP
jgi:hypothetical protein